MADKLYPKDAEFDEAQCATKFFFVRHPFERLVSCFRDKFELGSTSDYIYKNFKIVQDMTKNQRPTFSQFVDYLIGQVSH